jgi:hypothetical protein
MKEMCQPAAARQSGRWGSLDDATLTRLTWLWLAYGGFALTAGQRGLPSVCPFRLITGHRCPLCGLTRSVNYFLRGSMASSLRAHWAGAIIFTGSGIFLASAWHSHWPDALPTGWPAVGRRPGMRVKVTEPISHRRGLTNGTKDCPPHH